MKKRIIAVLAVGLVLLSGAWCGGEKETSASDQPGQKVTLTFWDMNWGSGNNNYVNAGEALAQKFNATHPNIEVKYQSIPWDNYYQVFLTAIKGGAGPDVATSGSQVPILFAQMGEILPLNSIVDQWKAEGKADDFIPGFLESNYFKGEYIALPWNADARLWTYRTDFFAQAGITRLPETWDDLLNAMRALKMKFPDKVPYAWYGDAGGTQHLMNWLTISNDCGPVNKNEAAYFNSPNMKQCLQFIAALCDEGLVSEATISYKQADAERLFLTGDAAIFLGGIQNAFLNVPGLAGNLGILNPMRGPSASKPMTVVWANSIYGASQTKNPDAAKVFIKWWLENNLSLFVDGGATSMPAKISFMKDPYFQKNPFTKTVSDVVYPTFTHATHPVPNFYPAYGQINGERYTGEAAQKVLSGRRDLDAILAEGQAKTEAAVKLVASN
jgi:multiple sugar transport system substrate-binding protein